MCYTPLKDLQEVVIVSINYADTVSMYYEFNNKYPYNLRMPKPWVFVDSNKDAFLHYWKLKLDRMFLVFYPDMYGAGRLFVTYSLPNLLKGSNIYNVRYFDEDKCYQIIQNELKVFPWSILAPYDRPISFYDWQCSRLDLFIMHRIPVGKRQDYMDSYELLTLPRYRSVKYENTCYINSSLRPDKKSNKVFRAYPKLAEVADRICMDYPLAIHRMHEYYLQTMDRKEDLYRFEFMLRRSIIKYECKKRSIQTNMHEVFQQKFQEELLSSMISAVGLDRRILHRNEYVKEVKQIFKTHKTKSNALLLARCIRNRQAIPLSYNQIYTVKTELKKHNIHFVTNKYTDLLPVKFPTGI